MKMSNIRPNFTEMDEQSQRNFFLTYADKRNMDFINAANITVKTRRTKDSTPSSKEPKLKITSAQLELLKALNLV